MFPHICLGVLLTTSSFLLQAIATVIDVPLAQSTTQMCTIPPPSSVSFYTCINDLSATGYTLQCCNTVQQSTAQPASQLLNALSITVNPATATVGIQCTRINGAWSYSALNCNAQVVCCQNDDYNGVIPIGCFPVTPF